MFNMLGTHHVLWLL